MQQADCFDYGRRLHRAYVDARVSHVELYDLVEQRAIFIHLAHLRERRDIDSLQWTVRGNVHETGRERGFGSSRHRSDPQ